MAESGMDEDVIIVGLLTTLGIGMVAVVVGAWLPAGKRFPDWFMAIGGTMALLGFGVVVLILFDGVPRWARDEFAVPAVLATIALGVLLFSMGYVMDRWEKSKLWKNTLPER